MDSERETPVASTSATPASSSKHDPARLNRKRTHIQMGDTVLLQLPSKNVRVARMKDDVGIISLGKYGAFDARTELIGRPYGVTYEIVPSPIAANEEDQDVPSSVTSEQVQVNDEQMDVDQALKQEDEETSSSNKPEYSSGKQIDSESNQPLCTLRPLEELTEEIEVTEATNENILATGAKTLSHEDIMELKRQGVDGREIIARQIAEHEAFALKNVFSKAKYQKRKESKFLKYFTVLPPTIHNICKYWNDLEAKKIRDLRSDTLAEMLTLANIRPGSRVIVVDDTSGLLVGAVAERMAGQGLIFQLHQNDSPPANVILPLYNLPSEYTNPEVFKALHWGWTDPTWVSAEDELDDEEEAIAGGAERTDKQRHRLYRRRQARDALMALVNEYRAGDFDALVVSSYYEPMSILEHLLPSLGGSAQIVIHSPVLQPLSDMLQSLMTRTDESVLNPTIVEPWLRQYQVLPGRTHPEMNGTPHGGYLLHGIKVIDATGGVKAISAGKGDRGRGGNKRRKK